jgi:YidC/Oxa1 family membrane protein insertase
VLNPLYQAVAFCLVHIYDALGPIFGEGTGAAWALSIVLLTLAMRIVLIPLFVKQIKVQRQMQVMQPKIKELQAKYKNDREKLNQELMALYREQGTNPLMGCLPLLLQFPIFIGLFHILNAIKPRLVHGAYTFKGIHVPGFPSSLIQSAARAKIFGVPIASNFTASHKLLTFLHASSSSTRILVVILIVAMGATTFVTQRQLLGRTAAQSGQMAQQQKVLMYVLPFVFLIFGFRFQLGVLLYWVTSNLWSMGQQQIVIRRMEAGTAGAGGSVGKPPEGPSLGPRPGQRPAPAPSPAQPTGPGSSAPAPASVGARRPGGNRNRRNRRGRR